ncbi:MAG: SUMF1/EgtB/PvdO family nonheme iron enzyme [Gemmataceae bacterium]
MRLPSLRIVLGVLAVNFALFAAAFLAWSPQQPPTKASEQPVGQHSPKEVRNKYGMKFVWVRPGTFLMGTPKGEERGQDGHDETSHKVTLTKGFYMGVHLVTQEQWQDVLGYNPSQFQREENLPWRVFPGTIARNSSRS